MCFPINALVFTFSKTMGRTRTKVVVVPPAVTRMVKRTVGWDIHRASDTEALS